MMRWSERLRERAAKEIEQKDHFLAVAESGIGSSEARKTAYEHGLRAHLLYDLADEIAVWEQTEIAALKTAAADTGRYVYPEEILFAYALISSTTGPMREEVVEASNRLRALRSALNEAKL